MNLSRRTALLGIATSFSLAGTSLALVAAPTDKRLVVVILRGALDGMAAVVPYGDSGLVGLRGEIVPPAPGQPDGLLDLGGFFGLHPAMAGLHAAVRAWDNGRGQWPTMSVAGRIAARRGAGKMAFLDLVDRSGKAIARFAPDVTPDAALVTTAIEAPPMPS